MATGWMIVAVVLIVVLLCVMSTLRVASDEDDRMEAEAANRQPVILDAGEDTLHPQDYEPVTAAVTDEEITQAAQVVWGEARGIHSQMEQAAVVWCALNRVDEWGDSLGKIVTAPGQFAYSPENPTVDDYGRDLEELVRDVVDRWEREKAGEAGVGRVLPRDFLWFGGDGGRNWFRNHYDNFDYLWSWRLPNPYDT